MAQVKYIADGFLTDASKLVQEFFERNCLEFSAFADVWKKHNFSFIYLGRESIMELSQFSQEIFKRTTILLLSNTFRKQVGSVFLLYALYRNQVLEPKIPIRVEYHVFRILRSIRDKAIEEKLRSLHYVLDYLFDNAFVLVTFQTLMGPTVRSIAKRFEPKHSFQVHFESSLDEFKKSGLLGGLVESFERYGELRKSTQYFDTCKKISEFMSGGPQQLEKPEISEQVSVEPVEPAVVSHNSIGSRRAELKLKAAQFYLKDTDVEDTDLSTPAELECLAPAEVVEKVSVCRTRRQKKSKLEDDQKLKMFDEDSDDSLSELFKSKLPKPSVGRRNEKPHRIRRYYKEVPSPVRGSVENELLADCEDELVF